MYIGLLFFIEVSVVLVWSFLLFGLLGICLGVFGVFFNWVLIVVMDLF